MNLNEVNRLLMCGLFAVTIFASAIFAEETTDNPTGVAGIYNGNVTDGGSWDPLTGNEMRVVDDIVVPGSVGSYPLKWTRYSNSRLAGRGWTFSYRDYQLFLVPPSGWANGGWAFPDGRTVAPAPSCASGTEEMVLGNTIFFADGGNVTFQSYPWLSCFSDTLGYHCETSTAFLPIIIRDPYGVATELNYSVIGHDDNNNPFYRLDTVSNGLRYLKILYAAEYPNAGVMTIAGVEAHDAQGNLTQWVHYTWSADFIYLERADYSDGTWASYGYNSKDLVTADDVRYAGPMRQIQYEYTEGENGPTHKIKYEKNLSTQQIVTERTDIDGVLTEIRGDGPSRSFNYGQHQVHAGDLLFCTAAGGKLVSYTDFFGGTHTTTINYVDGDIDTTPNFGFIESVVDPNGHKTRYERQAHSWGIKKIVHDDDTFIAQTFWPANGQDEESSPWYLASRTDENGNRVNYTRDYRYRITDKTYPDLSYEHFDYNDAGQVLTHRMRSGAYEHFYYDSTGLLIAKTVPTWNSVHGTMSADSFSQDDSRPGPGPTPSPTPVPAYASGITTYSYYSSGPWSDRVYQETDPRGNTKTYEYDHSFDAGGNETGTPAAGVGRVTRITCSDGEYQAFGYNKYGDKLWEEIGNGESHQRTSYQYDDYGRVIKVTDPFGHFTTHDYQKPGTSSAGVTTFKEPFFTQLPAGEATQTTYDNNWRKTAVVQLDGSTNPTTQYFYDEGTRDDGSSNIGLLTSVVDPNQHETFYTYDKRDRKIATTDALGHSSGIKYDAVGNVIWVIRTDGGVEIKSYDSMNRIQTDEIPKDAPTDYTTTTFEYYPGDATQMAGQLWHLTQQQTDSISLTTTFEYDPAGLKSKMIYPNGDYQSWTYDLDHNLIARQTVNGASQLFGYDLHNRQVSMAWSDGADWANFGYDFAGRMTSAENPSAIVARSYDDAGRITDDRQQFRILPITAVSRRTHGSVGGNVQTFDIILPLTGTQGVECRLGDGPNHDKYQIVVTFPRAVTFSGASVTTGTGSVDSSTHADQNQIIVNLTGVANQQNIVVTLAGVNDGIVTNDVSVGMGVLQGDTNGDRFTDSIDKSQAKSQAGNSVTTSNFREDLNCDGLIDAIDAAVAGARSGTALGSVLTLTQASSSSPIYDVQYGYDDSNKITQLAVAGTSYNYTFGYDPIGRFKTIAYGNSPMFQYVYDDASNEVRRKNLVNGVDQVYGRDEINRMTRRDLIQSGQQSFSAEVYSYDPIRPGLINSVSHYENSVSQDWTNDTFAYDFLPELINAQYGWQQGSNFGAGGLDIDPTAYGHGPPTLGMQTGGPPVGGGDDLIVPAPDPNNWVNPSRQCTYVWDKAGNRASMTDSSGPSCSYGVNNLNQYWTDGVNVITSGNEHELSNYQGIDYKYINDTHLKSVTGNGQTYQLSYDPLGRCVVRNLNGKVNYYVYDGEKPILEYSSNYHLLAANLYGHGIDEILMRTTYPPANGTNGGDDSNATPQFVGTVYYQDDHEGSITHLTDENGSVLEWYRYDAFGAPAIFNAANTQITGSNFDNRFLFTGREYMPSFGIYEYRNRAYHPGLGRFMTEDPKGFEAGDNNFFRYVGNDPLDRVDPMGLMPVVLDEDTESYVQRAVIAIHLALDRYPLMSSRLFHGMVSPEHAASVIQQDSSTHKDITAVSTDRDFTQVRLPSAPDGWHSLVDVHNHPYPTWNTESGSHMDTHDIMVGIATGRTQVVTFGDGHQERFRPSAKATWQEREEDPGVIEWRPVNGEWQTFGAHQPYDIHERLKRMIIAAQKEGYKAQAQARSTEPADIGGQSGFVMDLGFSKTEGLVGAGGGSP